MKDSLKDDMNHATKIQKNLTCALFIMTLFGKRNTADPFY